MSKRIELGFRLSHELNQQIRHEALVTKKTITQVITERLEKSYSKTKIGLKTPDGFTHNWEDKT